MLILVVRDHTWVDPVVSPDTVQVQGSALDAALAIPPRQVRVAEGARFSLVFTTAGSGWGRR